MRIIFSGGGTLGPVMPLLAIYQELKKNHPHWSFLWVGTVLGPEKALAEAAGLPFQSLPAVKWRRYWSWHNLIDAVKFFWATLRALVLIRKWRPDLLVTAGGYVSVPLHLAGKLLGTRSLVHQQDVEVGLANKLMAYLAAYVATSLQLSVKEFPAKKTIWLGNPVRAGISLGSREVAIQHFGLEPNLPTVLVLGGGTGALTLNKLVVHSLDELIDHCQIIHMTGPGKMVAVPRTVGTGRDRLIAERYHPVLFLEEDLLANAYAAADLIICRAGFSTLSELCYLAKPAVLVPICQTHQEENARYLSSRSGAPVFYEDRESREQFAGAVKKLLADEGERKMIGHSLSRIMPLDAREKMAFLIEEIARKMGKEE